MAEQQKPKIGHMLEGPGDKDAIHIAVVPVQLGEDMEAGAAVNVVNGKAYRAYATAIGILDPFLNNSMLFEDSWVYMFLYPNTITDLRHEWTLSSYDNNSTQVEMPRLDPEAVEWLENFAHSHGTSYDALLVRCKEAIEDDDSSPYITFYGTDIHEVPHGFWNNFRKATGWEADPMKLLKITFSCSC